jgi:putative ABC transport system permease protein
MTKFFPLLFANLRRKKIRTALTIGSFAVALFLFGLLVTIDGAFSQGVDVAGADRLVVINKVSLINPLPLSYRDRLLQTAGVGQVTWANWFGGQYQDGRVFFPQFAIDHQSYRQMFPEFIVSDADWAAFSGDREGAIVGAKIAERFGWKVGDRVPIRGTIFPGTWEFNVRGIYKGSRPADDETQFWFRWDYLSERGPDWIKGIVGWYTVRVADPNRAEETLKAIDAQFVNSPYETRTDTEKAFAASFVKQMGNIRLIIVFVGVASFVTLLLVTGSAMWIAFRERISELAVLKTLGFSDAFVLRLVLAESLLVSFVGGALGIGLAKMFTLGGDPTGGMLPVFLLPNLWVGAGIAAALSVGLVSGAFPAAFAARLRIVDALRRV